ncbi:MAG: 4Fe-4S binding protein, partial [Clostridiales bacterium]
RPQTDQNCNQCGICAENCPVNAISATEPDKTDDNICISCLRCIKLCPQKARKLDQARLSAVEKVFAEKFSIRKEPEIFI